MAMKKAKCASAFYMDFKLTSLTVSGERVFKNNLLRKMTTGITTIAVYMFPPSAFKVLSYASVKGIVLAFNYIDSNHSIEKKIKTPEIRRTNKHKRRN